MATTIAPTVRTGIELVPGGAGRAVAWTHGDARRLPSDPADHDLLLEVSLPDLDSTAHGAVPATGALRFFARYMQNDDDFAGQVIWLPDATKTGNGNGLSGKLVPTIPELDSPAVDDLVLTDEEEEAWIDASNEFRHLLLGYPNPVQADMERELCENGEPHRLLLQVDASKLNLAWGAAAMVYFWITESDLQATRFDRCVAVLQHGP